MEKNVSKFHLS